MRTDPIVTAHRAYEVVVVGELSIESAGAVARLNASGVRSVAVASLDQAGEALDQNSASVVILAASLARQPSEAVEALRRDPQTRHVPLVAEVSGNTALQSIRAFRAGATDVLTVPYEPEQMIARIGVHLHQRRDQRTLEATIRGLEQETRKLRDELQNAHAKLQAEKTENERVSVALLKALEGANRHKDNDRGNHVKRVAACAALLARMHGCGPEFADRIERAAPLHDIGKIAIPDSVLARTGRYTLEERTIMQRHTLFGVELLDETLDPMVINIVRSHHERWDGTGYPDRLRGVGIPLEARLVAVADRYDALLSPRPNRAALSAHEAKRAMEDSAATHLDPDLVELVLLRYARWHETWLEAERGTSSA